LVQDRKTPGSHSIGSDFDVEMAPSVDLMQFDKEQTVNVQFEMGGFPAAASGNTTTTYNAGVRVIERSYN
jgi:hypothetical protein